MLQKVLGRIPALAVLFDASFAGWAGGCARPLFAEFPQYFRFPFGEIAPCRNALWSWTRKLLGSWWLPSRSGLSERFSGDALECLDGRSVFRCIRGDPGFLFLVPMNTLDRSEKRRVRKN